MMQTIAIRWRIEQARDLVPSSDDRDVLIAHLEQQLAAGWGSIATIPSVRIVRRAVARISQRGKELHHDRDYKE